MPITQRRLVALVEAIETYQLAFDFISDRARQFASEIESGTLTPAEAFSRLAMEVQYRPEGTRQADILQSKERLRYRMTHSRNARDRAAKERQRRGALPPDRAGNLAEIERLVLQQTSPSRRTKAAGADPPRTAAEVAAAVDADDPTAFDTSDVEAMLGADTGHVQAALDGATPASDDAPDIKRRDTDQ
jgi:hypothetical protein